MTLTLLLAGYGTVARRFVTLLDETRPALNALGIDPVVAGVLTRRHGSVLEEASGEAGLDATTIARRLAEGSGRESVSVSSALEWCARKHVEARVLIDAADYRGTEFAVRGSFLKQPYSMSYKLISHVIAASVAPDAFAVPPQPGEIVIDGDGTNVPPHDVVVLSLRELTKLKQGR